MLDLNKAGLVYFLEVTEMMTVLKKNRNYLQENEYTQNCYLYKGNAVYNSKTSKILSNETSSFIHPYNIMWCKYHCSSQGMIEISDGN